MKRGFTIVELMMVVGIIAILMTIVTTAASSSIRQSRVRRAKAICTMVQTACATYYAQKGQWPGNIGSAAKNGTLDGNYKDSEGEIDPTRYELTASDVKSVMDDLVQQTKLGNPMMDVMGLFVSRQNTDMGSDNNSPGANKGLALNAYGMDFSEAIKKPRKAGQNGRPWKSADMYFGYPMENGRFRRFYMIYSIPADNLSVMRWEDRD